MPGRVLRIAAIATLLVALTIPSVSGQPETVELQLKLGRGETVFHTHESSVQLTLDVGSVHQEVAFQAQGRRAIRALEIDAEGTMLVEAVLEELQLTSAGRTEDHVDRPILVRVRPNGKVVERQIGAANVDDFPVALPGRPVGVGDSWTRQSTVEEAGITGTARETITLSRIEHTAQGRVAHLTVRTEGTVTGADLTQTLPAGVQARVSGTIRANSMMAYAVEGSRPLSSASDFSMDVQLELTGIGGRTVTGTMKLTGMDQERPLDAKDVKFPPIPANLLIVPGKTIGAVSLDLPVAEVTGQFGEPTSAHAFGHLTTILIWPNRLEGHVEAADPTKLVGLETSDRTHRTDKGIGFGSSQGAVLLAYGMTPTRVEMTDPAIGGVRVLIYNEQGIAFAITSDQAHADRGPSHAPIGAVDWTTVFPPGGAAKIYPLP